MIAKFASDPSGMGRRWSFVNSARTGWKYLLTRYLEKNKKVLLPAYIGQSINEGSGVFDPVRQLGIGYNFYRVSRKLKVDLDDVERSLKTSRIGVVLVIHYFGFVQKNMKRMAELCKNYGAVLVEDCAHVMITNGEEAVGNYGQASFFSLHKWFPCNLGGVVQINGEGENLTIKAKDKIALEDLEVLVRTRKDKVAETRRKNYRNLAKRLRNTPGIELMYPALPPETTPMNLPLVVMGKPRSDLYWKLQHQGVQTTALYYALISELDQTNYPDSEYVSERILNLPVHQDLCEKDMEKLALILTGLVEK